MCSSILCCQPAPCEWVYTANKAPLLTPKRVQANICCYLEVLCNEAAAAQAVWDTKLPLQLAGLLGSARSGLLRAHAAACLGLLIRHATYIPPSQSGELQDIRLSW